MIWLSIFTNLVSCRSPLEQLQGLAVQPVLRHQAHALVKAFLSGARPDVLQRPAVASQMLVNGVALVVGLQLAQLIQEWQVLFGILGWPHTKKFNLRTENLV